MARDSIVAVYGVAHGDDGPSRLGTGSLEHDRVVVLDPDLSQLLASGQPPEVLRVGIAGRVQGEPYVEVAEVRQVLSSTEGPEWAVELWTRARSPTVAEARALGPDGQDDGTKNPICYAFPNCSFC